MLDAYKNQSLNSSETFDGNSFHLTPEIHIYAKTRLTNLISSEFLNNTDLHESQPWQINWSSEESSNSQNDITLGMHNKQVYRIGDFIPVHEARNILIVTRGRSGSSFFGNLLNRYPGTFYSFEPLHRAGKRGISATSDKINFIKNILNCSPNEEYFKHAKEWKYSLSRNIRYWKSCSALIGRHFACYLPKFYYSTCPIFPIRLIKTIRLSYKETEELLSDPEISQSLKIIFLFRDPRGVQQSMKRICDNPGWKFNSCNDIQNLCETLNDDTQGALDIKQKYPGKL